MIEKVCGIWRIAVGRVQCPGLSGRHVKKQHKDKACVFARVPKNSKSQWKPIEAQHLEMLEKSGEVVAEWLRLIEFPPPRADEERTSQANKLVILAKNTANQCLLYFLNRKNGDKKMNSTTTSGVILFTLILIGCNTTSTQVQPEYISSFKYDKRSCSELKGELHIVEQRASSMAGKVDSKAESQNTKLAFGWLFWPSYFVIDDNNSEVKELAKVKGEYGALKEAMKTKKCD